MANSCHDSSSTHSRIAGAKRLHRSQSRCNCTKIVGLVAPVVELYNRNYEFIGTTDEAGLDHLLKESIILQIDTGWTGGRSNGRGVAMWWTTRSVPTVNMRLTPEQQAQYRQAFGRNMSIFYVDANMRGR